MPIAVITFDFDPLLRIGDGLVVRWQTLALAALIAAVLLIVGSMARRSALRTDDLLFIVIGIVPGAVLAGRIGYVATHPDGFMSSPLRALDPAAGGLDLAAGVVGGILAAVYVGVLLGVPVGRWAHLAAVPLLAAIGAGKLIMILGGSGQGLPSSAPWAMAFLPPGPWNSLAAALPSHPSQVYEGFATLGWAVALVLVASLVGTGRRDGRLLCLAVAGWAFLRAAISVTWRDPPILGPLSAGGWLAVIIGVGAVLVTVAVVTRPANSSPHVTTDDPMTVPDEAAPSWPEPETRPPF